MDVAGTKEWLKQRRHARKDVGEVASPHGGVDALGLGAERQPQFVIHTGAAPNHAATMTSAYSNNTSSLGYGPWQSAFPQMSSMQNAHGGSLNVERDTDSGTVSAKRKRDSSDGQDGTGARASKRQKASD